MSVVLDVVRLLHLRDNHDLEMTVFVIHNC